MNSPSPENDPTPPRQPWIEAWLVDDRLRRAQEERVDEPGRGEDEFDVAVEEEEEADRPRPRWVLLPLTLFFLTCLSTFWTGASNWMPLDPLPLFRTDWDMLDPFLFARIALVRHWDQGLLYMLSVLGILFAHEMGHFLVTVAYGIPASYPYFIPFPSPIGTMGAVISMEGMRANRRQLFDIGIAGPLAGLVVAVPVLIWGITQLDMSRPAAGIGYDSPLLVNLLIEWLPAAWIPAGLEPGVVVYTSQMNALYCAGWVGLFITGLNMIPVSQLDGGHVTYTLFGRWAHYLARIFLIGAYLYMVFADAMLFGLMLVLITLMGVDHPPTSDDRVELGWPRTILGLASLALPILCFPPRVFIIPSG